MHGARDDAGQLTGTVRYWDADGVFISSCEHQSGKPNGRTQRFYPDGSLAQECEYIDGRIEGARSIFRPASDRIETPPQLSGVHASVAVYECVYRDGDLVGTRYRDEAGIEVEPYRGTPVPERPPGVPETAGPFQGGWLFMHRRGEDGDEVLETRIYYADGSPKEVSLPDGTEREFHETGALRAEGKRVERDGKRPTHGLWRYGDAHGFCRRESRYVYGREESRTWRRPEREAGDGGAVQCAGPTASPDRFDAVECGVWTFRDHSGAVLRELDLGAAAADEVLLADEALAEDADIDVLRARYGPDVPDSVGPAARVARLRVAGRTGTRAELPDITDSELPWLRLGRDGEYTEWNRCLVELINSPYFGPASAAIAALAARLFRADRPRVAHDLISAALLIGDDPGMRESRATYLRALGESEAAEALLDSLDPDRVQAGELALLSQIRERPDDDAARLTYAKHIAEIAPEHAALIRLDCGASRGSGDPAQRDQLAKRLAARLPRLMRPTGLEFERGFLAVEALCLDVQAFLDHHDTLFRMAPMAGTLTLAFASEQIAELATLPALRRYTGLSFLDTYLFGGGAAQLARSPHLEKLVHLGLRETCLYDDDLVAILCSSAYPRLQSLDISNRREGQNYTYPAFRRLAEARFAGTLERLAMDRRYFDDDVVAVLAALPRLHDLSLEGSSLGNGAIELCQLSRRWTRLDLSRSGIGPDAALAMASSASMTELVSLGIASNPLGDEGVSAIVTSPHLGRMRMLDMGGGTRDGTRPTAAFGRALVDAPMAGSLETLLLSLAALGPEGALALAEAPLQRLQRLNLHNNRIADEGAVALARSPHLGALRHLDLSGNEITDTGAYALAESATLVDLDWLELGGAELSARTRKALRARYADRVQFEYPWNRR